MIIREMQNKLAIWSSTDKERKFDRLLRIIENESWLQEAARITLASSGAKTPGIDGINKKTMECDLEYQLDAIRTELLAGNYQPQSARRVYIPKANGKQRPLGIPTLRDRIVQRAMLMVMEPIWESDFHRLSYGFRPERSVHHAIRTVKLQLQDSTDTSGRWVIEGEHFYISNSARLKWPDLSKYSQDVLCYLATSGYQALLATRISTNSGDHKHYN